MGLRIKESNWREKCKKETQYSMTLIKVPLWPKNQFIFFFGFQNYVKKTLSDPRFKPWFQKDTFLF